MKKNLQVLFITESENNIQEFVEILKDVYFNIVTTWVNIEVVVTTVLKANTYDLIILDATGLGRQKHETNTFLDIVETGNPIIAIVSEEADRKYWDNLDYPCFDYLYSKDILFLGQLAKRLIREAHLYNKVHDIEDELEKEKEWLNTALASIGEGVITTDIDGYVIFMNQIAEQLTGWNQDEANGRQIGTIFRNKDKEKNMESAFLRALRKGTKSGLKRFTTLISRAGNEFYISAKSLPIKDNSSKIIGMITVFRDITKLKKVETDLEDRLTGLKVIFDSAPISMIIVDKEFVIKNANSSFLNTFNITGDEVLNERIGKVLGCQESLNSKNGCLYGSACPDCKLKNAVEEVITFTKSITDLEITKVLNVNNQEVEHSFKINIVPILIEDLKHAIVVIDDITENRKLTEGLRRYQLLSENANDIILFADSNGYVIEANDAAIRAFGYEMEELLSKSIFYLVNPDLKSPVGAQPYQENNSGIYYEATAFRKDGSNFIAEVSMQGTESGSSKILMVILRDVTEKKRINEELRHAKESAESSNHAKSEFLANMSHEIRTPLNGMIGMIDLTLLSDLMEDQKDNLYTAKECANTLLNLINDILDLSKIEAGKLSIEYLDFNIRELLEQTIKPLFLKAQGKGLLLKFSVDDEIPQVVNGDPYRLKQIISNLVGNAVKFTNYGEVSICIGLKTKKDECVELEFQIADTGIGMTSEDMGRLFYSFSQVDSSHTRKYGGTGLGLAISKQLVEIMSGSIWVKSIKEKGSTFYFTVKLGNGNMAANTYKPVIPVRLALHPLRILLVEDDKINQIVISRMLQETGHKIVTANNGLEALQVLNNEDIDIIIMDIQMPEMDGIETTKRIRKEEVKTGGHIPIIALTAYALQGDRDKFLSIGMNGYISKPIQINSFLDTVETIAERLLGSRKVKMDSRDKNEINGNESEINKFLIENAKSMESFMDNIEESIILLKGAIEHNDLSGIEKYAHVVKKFSSEINAITVKGAAFKVELAARRGNITEAAECVALVTKEMIEYKKTYQGQ